MAIPTYKGRISPLCDTALALRVYCCIDSSVSSSYELKVERNVISQLLSEGVGVLICGAITRCMANALVQKNIRLIPFVCGQSDMVAEQYAKGKLTVAAYAMAGCKKRLGTFKFCPRFQDIEAAAKK